ncbi:MAG: Hsp20/alpha crystallin family protein [Clostridia bacterium]|nr:Hsp20/alpha crystallin family protein [Clostridia bacterium]
MSTYLPTIFGENMMDMFDDFDRSFFRGMNGVDRALYGKRAQNMMKTDIRETDEAYEISVELPGFSKDEISVELDKGYLTIATEKTLNKDENGPKGKLLRQERYVGTMRRSFFVGDHLTEEDIKAAYENGVLTLTVPKKEARKVPERKIIHIEG